MSYEGTEEFICDFGKVNKWEPDPTARWELLPTDEEEAPHVGI